MQSVIESVQVCLKRVGNESVGEFYGFFRGIVRRPLAVIRIAAFDGLIAKAAVNSVAMLSRP